MESPTELRMPAEMLGRILHFLAMDGAAVAWQHLAYLTHNNNELRDIAKKSLRPLVLRVVFDGAEETGDRTFILPFRKATVAQIEIDWGDDSPTQIFHEVGKGLALHEYKSAGPYTVRVFPHGPGVDAVWLDHLGWNAYEDCADISWWRPLRYLDTLGSLGIISLEALFTLAEGFNLPLPRLDVSRIENMSFMFSGAANFNENIGDWNVSRVRSMEAMFFAARRFNRPIGGWDTSNVTTMSNMFRNCDEFNQDISAWNVSNVTSMHAMFFQARVFNTPIGQWNVSKCEDMYAMQEICHDPIGWLNAYALRNIRDVRS